jgi:hypothetical protein
MKNVKKREKERKNQNYENQGNMPAKLCTGKGEKEKRRTCEAS